MEIPENCHLRSHLWRSTVSESSEAGSSHQLHKTLEQLIEDHLNSIEDANDIKFARFGRKLERLEPLMLNLSFIDYNPGLYSTFLQGAARPCD